MDNEQLLKIAIMAMNNAYAPLTNYKVGAALLAKSGTVYIGANVEVPSGIGISNCAERVAIQSAYAQGEREFLKIVIVGSNSISQKTNLDIVPCGVCLQYISEMCKNVDIITLVNGELVTRKVSDFLTEPYDLKK